MLFDWKKRRDALRKKLISANFDAMLISYAANRYYLSGFELHDVQFNESAGYLIVASDGRDFLVTDPRFLETAKKVFPENDIYIYKRKAFETLASLLRRCGKRIAIEKNALSWDFAVRLQESARDLAWGRGDDLVGALRVVKEAQEIAALEKSFAVNHAMLAWLEGHLEAGMREAEIAWKIEAYFREHGASELAFPSIVAVNNNAAMAHAIPGDRPLTAESLVLVDVGCRVDDYCSDQTRTLWFGEQPSAEFTKTRALVLEAQACAIDMMKPGVLLRDVDACARAIFAKAGVEAAFTHGLGHGVGLETHERPSLSPHGEGVLEEGMVVTVEPGLYYPEWGGVRHEYTVVLEKDRARVL